MAKLIAEIGWNFIGDVSLAKKMIKAAKDSGADYAKFQTWSTKFLKKGPWDKDGRMKLYKKSELSEKNHLTLIEHCKKMNINFLTSVFNINSLFMLKQFNLKIIKIASMEIVNKKLLKEADKNYEKILISTGASNFNEVKNIFKHVDKKKCTLMHCVSSYPTPAKNINLPRINKLRKICPRVGYSGHLNSISDALASLNYNPDYIEKHFTTNNNLPGRDNKFSVLPQQFKILSDLNKDFVKMNMFRGVNYQSIEKDVRDNYRGRWSKI